MKKLLIMLQSDFPPDVRLKKEIRVFENMGYQIHLLCNNRKGRFHKETHQNLIIHRMMNITHRDTRLNRFLTAPTILNPVWVFTAMYLLIRYRIQVIHVVNLPLAPIAVVLGRIFRLPVIYDMYENYPEAIRSWNLTGMKRVTRHPKIAQFIDNVCSKLADKVIVVVDEAKDRLVRMGFDPQKICVISNTVDLTEFHVDFIDETIIQQYKNYFCLVYTGLFSPERGIETAIDAIPQIIKSIPNCKLLLVGDGPSLPALISYVIEKGIEDYVVFTGWIDYALFPTYIKLARVCIIPQPSNPFIDTTIPNKLFEYMAMGKPVLVSDAKPLLRIVTAWKCGEVFKSESPSHFAECLFSIRDREKDLGENGRKAIEKEFRWEYSSKELEQLYKSIEEEMKL